MIRRNVTILGSVLAVLASSAIGATALRSPDAKATDMSSTVDDVVDAATEELDQLRETTIEIVEPVLQGVGEKVLLVVAARAGTTGDAQRLLSETNAKLGELQGFYVDEARNYDLTGLLVQTSPDLLPVTCPTADGGQSTFDCPEGVSSVNELQPIRLEYVPQTAIPSLSLPACGDVGLAPCQDGTIRDLLRADLDLATEDLLVVSAFRTKRGAEEFLELTRAAGITGTLVLQATKLGGVDVGLGQEPHPDGSGPLLRPLPDQESYQR